MDRSVDISFGGNAGGLLSAINASVQAMTKMEAQSKGFASSIVASATKTLAPIALAVGAAFASQNALKDFSESSLPGVGDYKKGIDASKESIKGLSASFGEFLAPSALFVANSVKKIADYLTPLVRQFTGFYQSSKVFLLDLGKNIIGAFAPLLPTVTGVVNGIKGLFSGPARDWGKTIEDFRARWNAAWSGILEYTAPIMVAASNAIESGLKAVQEIGAIAFDAIKQGAGSAAEFIKGLLPATGEAGGGFQNLSQTIQQSLVTAFSAAEFALKNWRDTLDVAIAGAKLGASILGDAWSQFSSDLKANGEALWVNLQEGVETFAANAKIVISELGEYVQKVFRTVASNAKLSAFNIAENLAGRKGIGLAPMPDPRDTVGKTPLKSGSYGNLPGFSAPQDSDRTKAARDAMPGAGNNFADRLGDFLKEPLGDVAGFIKRITAGLPNVSFANLGPSDVSLTPSDKHAGAMTAGSREAYSAILQATSGNASNKQLDALKTLIKVSQDIATGVKTKPTMSKI